MACGQKETVTIRYWGICWKWGFIPYPCRKTNQVTRYRYDFNHWRTRYSYSPILRKYEACCGAMDYIWSYWTWNHFGTGNGPWVHTSWLYYSSSPISSTGGCPFNPTTV